MFPPGRAREAMRTAPELSFKGPSTPEVAITIGTVRVASIAGPRPAAYTTIASHVAASSRACAGWRS